MNFKLKTKYLFSALCFVFLVSCNKTEVLEPSSSSPYCGNSHENGSSLVSHKDVSNSIGKDKNDKDPTVLDHSIPFTAIQGAWRQTEVLDPQGNSTTCAMIYAHLPDALKFSTQTLHPVGWIETAGFNLLDFTPDTPHECYHAMYQVNGEDRLIDIVNLYCSTPIPPAGRCGPPTIIRFKITHISQDKLILESYASSYDLENIDQMIIPAEQVQSYVFERF